MISVEKFKEIKSEDYNIFAAYVSENIWVDSDRLVLFKQDKKTGKSRFMLVCLADGTEEVLEESDYSTDKLTYSVSNNKMVYCTGDKVGMLDLDTRENEIVYRFELTEKEKEILFTDKYPQLRDKIFEGENNLPRFPHLTNDGRYISLFKIHINFASAEANGYIPDKYTEFIVIDAKEKKIKYTYQKVFKGSFWVANHMAVNPVSPDIFAFSHEGETTYIPNRIWLYDNRKKRAWNVLKQESDGDNVLLEFIGHELWAPSGRGMYYVKYNSSEKPSGIGYLDLDTESGKILYSAFPYWHCTVSNDETMLAGDTQPHPNVGLCNVIIIDRKDGSENLIDTVKETGTHPSHPHPQIAPDNSKVAYTYLDDNGNIAVKIAYINR